MEYRRLGKSGLKVSALSFGSWVTFGSQIQNKEAFDCLAYAYERGINFFDNAEVYASGESEKVMGESIKKLGWARDTFCVSSKVFWGGKLPTQLGLNRKHVFEACHAALKRLQVDYLDLYFCHRPDPETPIEETAHAMNDLIRQGKVLYWGTSEWSADQIESAYEYCESHYLIPPTMEQPEYNMFQRTKLEKEYLPLFERYGMGTTIWSPLASGILSGKYAKGIPKESRAELPIYGNRITSPEGQEKVRKASLITEIAEQIEVTTAQLSLAWCLKNPNVSSVILGASRKSQLEENLKALEALPKITPAVMEQIRKII